MSVKKPLAIAEGGAASASNGLAAGIATSGAASRTVFGAIARSGRRVSPQHLWLCMLLSPHSPAMCLQQSLSAVEGISLGRKHANCGRIAHHSAKLTPNVL